MARASGAICRSVGEAAAIRTGAACRCVVVEIQATTVAIGKPRRADSGASTETIADAGTTIVAARTTVGLVRSEVSAYAIAIRESALTRQRAGS
jgi:hypothetical protein